jgi:excisionase family DNA binding protein
MPKTYDLLTIPEVARQLDYKSRDSVYAIIKAKKLRTCIIGGRTRVAQSDLDDYIASVRKIAAGEKKKAVPQLVAKEVE